MCENIRVPHPPGAGSSSFYTGNVFIDGSDTGSNSPNHGEIDMENSTEGEKILLGFPESPTMQAS